MICRCPVFYIPKQAGRSYDKFEQSKGPPWQRVDRCAFLNAHAARCVACQGVGSRPVPVALVGECSIPVV